MGALLVRKLFNQQSIQERLDVATLCQLVFYYQRCGSQQDLDSATPQPSSFEEQYFKVHSSITAQLKECLGELHEQVQQDVDKISLPFSLSIKKSTINHPAAGNGVFLKGSAVPGSFVMFHPGLLYLAKDIRKMPNYPNISQDNDYLMCRYDGSLLDAKQFNTDIVFPSGKKVSHPLACGHMVNHPPAAHDDYVVIGSNPVHIALPHGVKPNIMPFNYDFMESFPSELMYLVPNRYFRFPGILYKTAVAMRTILFVAIKNIENEELFVNYRMNPANKLPDWYTAVDLEQDKRRWNTD